MHPVVRGALGLGDPVADALLGLPLQPLGRLLGGGDDRGHALGRQGSAGVGRLVRAGPSGISHDRMVERLGRPGSRGCSRRLRGGDSPSNLQIAVSERRYDPKHIEPKWQEIWERERTWEVSNDPDGSDGREKSYVLEMLPYPSGEPHIGHLKNYALGDAIAHFHRRIGRRVLHPMGYDAFGLPAENNAIKTGVHPRVATDRSIASYRHWFHRWGISIDWSRELGTHEPTYYRWTQWIFLKLFERDLAYKKTAAVNWCPNDQTVLANEQVIDGHCERCGHLVEVRQLEQWFFRITDYADRLLDDLDTIAWPEHVKAMQRNWIGRSEGAEVVFRCEELGIDYPVFTTRPDTLFGATFFVMAPEHPDVFRLAEGTEHEQSVHEYVNRSLTESPELRGDTEKPKTGVPLGRTVTNPVTGEQIPMFVSDYVLMEYGTGAIMAVPAHDQRDYDFAKAFGPEIRRVVAPQADERRSRWRRRSTSRRWRCLHRPHRKRGADQLRPVHGDERGRGPAGDRRVARPRGQGSLLGQLQAARLAGLAPALLGLPDPDRVLRQLWHGRRSPRPTCRSSCPTSRTTSRRVARRWPRLRTGSTRAARTATAPRGARPTRWTRSSIRVGTTCATATRTTTGRRGIARCCAAGCRSTSTSAASSTRFCT